MSDDSACIVNMTVNRLFKHMIKPNKTITEPRISITFRTIETFIHMKTNMLSGKSVVYDGTGMNMDQLVLAWGRENSTTDDPKEIYKQGINTNIHECNKEILS